MSLAEIKKFTDNRLIMNDAMDELLSKLDVAIDDMEQGRVAVFEVKYAKTLNDMSSQCAKALKQIQDKMYAKDYEDEYEEIDCYGISFYKKRCMIRRL